MPVGDKACGATGRGGRRRGRLDKVGRVVSHFC